MSDGRGLSRAASALVSRYRGYVGKQVVVSGPLYRAQDGQDASRQITGTVLGLAWRENGKMAGTIFDMVIQAEHGVLRTIALSRITNVDIVQTPVSQGQT